jgi:hypothetical protein
MIQSDFYLYLLSVRVQEGLWGFGVPAHAAITAVDHRRLLPVSIAPRTVPAALAVVTENPIRT